MTCLLGIEIQSLIIPLQQGNCLFKEITSVILLQKDCRYWVPLICFYEGDSLSEGYQPKGCEQLTTEAYAFRSDVVLSFIFSKPVCAGWWDYNSCGSYWTVSTELVINNPENIYHICIVLKAFLAVNSKRKWNLGPLKKEKASYIWPRAGNWHVSCLIKTEATTLSVAWKYFIVGAGQDPSVLAGVFELAETRNASNLMFCLPFWSSHLNIWVPCSWIPLLHTAHAQRVYAIRHSAIAKT